MPRRGKGSVAKARRIRLQIVDKTPRRWKPVLMRMRLESPVRNGGRPAALRTISPMRIRKEMIAMPNRGHPMNHAVDHAMRWMIGAAISIVLLAPAGANAAQATSRPVRNDPASCHCDCSCVANAMFTSKRHAKAWARAYYETCGCG